MRLLERLRAARRSLSRQPAVDPTEPSEPLTLEEQVTELVRQHVADVTASEAHPPGDLWIFRQRPELDVTVRAIMLSLEQALQEERGRVAALASMDWSCCCRCRTHDRVACPLCLDVRRCPAHTDPDPNEVYG